MTAIYNNGERLTHTAIFRDKDLRNPLRRFNNLSKNKPNRQTNLCKHGVSPIRQQFPRNDDQCFRTLYGKETTQHYLVQHSYLNIPFCFRDVDKNCNYNPTTYRKLALTCYDGNKEVQITSRNNT